MPFHVTKVGDVVTASGQDRKPSRVRHTPSYSHWSMVLLGPSLTGHGAEPKAGWQKLCLTRHPKHTCRQERKMETQLEDPAQFLWRTCTSACFKRHCPLLTLSHASVLQEESKPVQMMCMNNSFNVATLPAEKMKILELPFASGDLSMLVLLPDEVSDLERVRPWQGKPTSSEFSGSWLLSDLWLCSHSLAVLCWPGRGAQQWPRCFQALRQRLASKESPSLNVIKQRV